MVCDPLAAVINDPNVTVISVCERFLARYAKALKGNTHVRKLDVRVSLPSDDGEALEKAMASWKGFCEVAKELSSLQELAITIAYDTPPQLFVVAGLLLKHLRQVKAIELSASTRVTDPAYYGGIIADSIANHPTLEKFWLEGFECSRDDSALPAVLGALMTVPNLKVFQLVRDMYDDGNDCQLSGKCDDCLGRLMRKGSLGSIKFSEFEFTDSQVQIMASAVESPESQLQAMSFENCRFSADSAQSLFRGIAKSTSLEDLSLDDTKLSGFDFNVHATNLLLPLSSSKSLKKMDLNLDVGEGEMWPHLSFLQTNSVLESLTVDFDSKPISDESLASLFEQLGANERSNLMKLYLSNLEVDADAIRTNMLAPLATNKSLKKLEIDFYCSRDDDVVVEWPRFDFLQENQKLEHFTFGAFRCVPGNGFGSLCRSLRTNSTVKTLFLMLYGGLNDGHCVSLAQMISDNVGLEEIVLGGSRFKRDGYRALVPGLIQNTNLRILELVPESLSEQVNGTDEFARSVLSQTRLRELVVGPWDADDPNPLLMITAKNYHIERLEFQGTEKTGAYRIPRERSTRLRN